MLLPPFSQNRVACSSSPPYDDDQASQKVYAVGPPFAFSFFMINRNRGTPPFSVSQGWAHGAFTFEPREASGAFQGVPSLIVTFAGSPKAYSRFPFHADNPGDSPSLRSMPGADRSA